MIIVHINYRTFYKYRIITDPICTTPQVGDHIINLNWNPKVNQQIMDQVGIDILHRKRELPY